jgi:hypothetical protein
MANATASAILFLKLPGSSVFRENLLEHPANLRTKFKNSYTSIN